MSEERKLILNMLKEGKISEDEALRLLQAVEGPKNSSEDDLESTVNSFANKIANSVNKAFKKTGDALSGIDVDWSTDFGKYRGKTDMILKTDLEEENSNIKIENTNGRIHIYTWDNDYIETRASISYDSKENSADYDFIITEKKDDYYYIGTNETEFASRFSANLSIALPRIKFGDFTITNTNGTIEINFLEAEDLNLKTINGKIQANSIEVDNTTIETSQGPIDVNDIRSKRLSMNTINGPISAKDLSVENIISQTINGVTRLAELNDEVSYIDTNTVNGNVYISIDDFNKPIKLEIKGKRISDSQDLLEKFKNVKKDGKSTIATTEAYDESNENNIEIVSSTVNGRITIS